MAHFEDKEYKIFEMFHKQWALVSAGTMENNNGCTVGWGSLGTLWTRPGTDGAVATVYIYPSRYTWNFLNENDTLETPPEILAYGRVSLIVLTALIKSRA